jgi:hypothetical protein
MAGGIASRSQGWNCRTNALAGKIVHLAQENTIPIIGRSENSRCFYPPALAPGNVSADGALQGAERVAEDMAASEWHRSLMRQSAARPLREERRN